MSYYHESNSDHASNFNGYLIQMEQCKQPIQQELQTEPGVKTTAAMNFTWQLLTAVP